ncbi:MAG: DNA-processing protein DprA [Spirochaetes bacterium]|nr:DNA-processing protein DprA [Spirochaetota bacterium]
MDREELVWFVLFNGITNCTPKQKLELFERYGSVYSVFEHRKEAEGAVGKRFSIDGTAVDVTEGLKEARRKLEACGERGIALVALPDDRYPVRLKYIYDPPLLLYAKGNVTLLSSQTAAGVVGSRKASNWGVGVAYSVGKELAKQGVTVVSGLALGIDYYAHRGALDGGGNTVAVLGNGIDVVYPKSNTDMYERIGKEGLLVSEFQPAVRPLKHHFPRRNRIISGLSEAVVVVEASKKSGALITARFAADQGREVMAFPGKATSEAYTGNNGLIKDGAHLVETPWDILSILGKDLKYEGEKSTFFCSPIESDILSVIGDEKSDLGEIEKALGRPVGEIVSALMMLELRGVLRQHPGKIFERVESYDG